MATNTQRYSARREYRARIEALEAVACVIADSIGEFTSPAYNEAARHVYASTVREIEFMLATERSAQ